MAAQATTTGEAMDLDVFTTTAGAVAPHGATAHGPAAEELLEGAEYDAETEDAAGASEAAAAAAAARVRLPRPSNRDDKTRAQMGILKWAKDQDEEEGLSALN